MAIIHFILVTLLFYYSVLETLAVRRPKISSQNGHLRFRASKNGNISLETTGKGTVLLNGVDLSNAVKMVLKSSQILNKYTTNFEDSFNKIDHFDSLLNRKNTGLIPRITKMEGEISKISNSTINQMSNVKLRRLIKQLQFAMTDLASLTSLLNQDECKSNPCSNGGTCQDLFNNFICHCPEEWEGQHCDLDVNECARFVGTDLGCQNGATCINKPGTYQCICANGWYGVHCTRRSKDCNTASSSSLCGHGTCVAQNTDLGYTCICDQGYKNGGSSQGCVDVDECKSSRPPCSVNPLVNCINTPGSFRCGNCPEGFTGNGFYCVDINECQSLQNGCSKNPVVECINTIGSYKCGPCPPGYLGDGHKCTFKGVCNVNNGGCHPLAKCSDSPNNAISLVECTCPSGYSGNGIGPNGCIPPITPWTPCLPNPCKNGTCIVTPTGAYTCRCNPPYFGKNCDMSLSPCANNPCKNGGVCLTRGYTFRCLCKLPWTGSTCNTERSACGGILSEKSGTLRYPPSNFSIKPEVGSCAWIIETSRNQILKLHFKDFHMRYTRECNKDWLQIHDGRNTASHSLGRYCGNDLPKNGSFTTTHNSVYIWFRTDGTSSSSGFELSWNSTLPTCDFNINATSHGSIQSPGSPGVYPNNRDCFWLINTPASKRLLFHFSSFDVGSSVNCSGDYLEIFSSSNKDSAPFAKYCNSSGLPSPVNSPGSVALVHFHSDDRQQHPGFQMSYSVVEGIPGCGGTFTSIHGEIQSPTYRGRYLSDLDCEYNIKLDPGLRVKIEFVSFDLEADVSCKYDYLEVFEGPDTSSPLIGRYCGSTLPGPYLANGNEITVHFKSDWATGFGGFVLRYETVCGGKFTEKSGIITSDGYPKHYAPGVSCIYEIIQPPGYIITLTFLDFRLEHSSDTDEPCFDYVEVRDGDYENSTLVGRYCNEIRPPKIVSSMNYLWLKFVSDESVSYEGFKATYNVTNLGCGGILKENTGIISPQFEAGSSGSALTCNWVIRAPPGNLIRVIWVTFQLKQRYICDQENVKVFDNNTYSGRGGLIGKYCGNKIPPSFISTSNIVTLILQLARTRIISSGFTLSYNFVKESKLCGGDFHSDGGFIRSPDNAGSMSFNTDCTWTITVQHNHQILLNVTKFNLDLTEDCKFDYLEIRNGKSASSPLIGRYCGGKISKLISSHANQLYLHFKTDSHGFGGSFEIIWESAATGCGGLLSAPSGSIISPMYPEPYNKFTDCHWKISVSAGSIVQIIFTDIDLEIHSFCLLDYVEVFDGSSAASKSLGRFCSLIHPTFIRTTQNNAYIRFKSDVSYQGRGFQLQYSTVCQKNITGFYGFIESPNFPNRYQLPEDCIWNIHVEPKNKINITFTSFDVRSWNDHSNKTCASNGLEIKYTTSDYESETPLYETYGKYCGHLDTPKLLTIEHDRIQLHYKTATLMRGIGFRLEWALEGCGGKLYNSGTIQSPNYPKGYPESSACRWELETDFGNSIVLTFDVIDMERANGCSYDSIQVYNGPDKSYPLLAHFCHQDIPVKVTSNGNKMSLYFTSDSSYQGRGFLANFTSVKSKCGGRLTLPQGKIFSPNYPKDYDRNTTCEWLIEVDENHLIDLEFEDVELLKNDMFCNRNYIKVYDGPNEAYPLLKKVCGQTKPNDTITSTHNTMFVQFKGESFVTAKGFMAKFFKACGARIVASVSGEIQMHPEFVDHGRLDNCSWTIVAPEADEHIALSITHMNVRFLDCSEGSLPLVSIYDGENTNGSLIGAYCGETVPNMIISRGNALHIVTDVTVFLNANYEVYDSSCGGTFNTLGGTIASPGFIKEIASYGLASSETDCEWNLVSAPGNELSLTFSEFNLPQSDKCKMDFLEIRRSNSSGKLLGTYCGDKKPENIDIEGGLWLYLKHSPNNYSTTPEGFKASFSIVKRNVLKKPFGQIANPLYPNYYTTYDDYTWGISVTFGKRILIKFKEISLGSHYESDCSGTGMKIYDGIDSSAPLMKEICAYEIPEPVKTSSNEAFITVAFTTGISKFLIEWEEFESYLSPLAKNTTVEGCGSADVIDMAGLTNYSLTSPGYPNGYADQLDCEWIFSTAPVNHLVVNFPWVDLRSVYGVYYSCSSLDSIEIFSGNEKTGEWKSIKQICSFNESNSAYLTSNRMKIKFSTDYSGNGTGFTAEVREFCGGETFDSEGMIFFDEKHPRGPKCSWNITVAIGKTISVEFPKFDIAPGQEEGCNNYLMLKNGLESDSPPLGDGKYCGKIAPKLETTSNRLSVKYIGSPNIKGFVLHFKAVSYKCGGYVELNNFENSTFFSSPNYPNVPPPHIECIWTIRSPPGTSIELDFNGRFDLTRSAGCSSEYLEVRDGATEYSPIVGKFCITKPNSQFSTDNMMYVKYVTDVDDPKNGFKATATLAKCGGTYRGVNGKLSWSSDDSRLQLSKNNCTWHIVAPKDYNLVIKVDALDMPASGLGCAGSLKGLRFYSIDPVRGTEQYVKTICSRTDDKDITINSNEAVIYYKHVSVSYTLKKFVLSYTAKKQNCTFNLNAPSGRISTPGYPRKAYRAIRCQWTITVPQGRRVRLTFMNLDLDENLEYQNQGIVIMDSGSFRTYLAFIRFNNGTTLDGRRQFKSSSNSMTIYYWSANAHGRGFLAYFNSNEESVCQGSFNETSGSISVPNATSFFCSWKRQQPSWNTTLKVAATMYQKPKRLTSGNCLGSSSAMMIHYPKFPMNLQFSLCSNTSSPAVLRTSYPNLNLQIWGREDSLNFTFDYNTYPCGGLRSEEIGQISSPNYPNKPSSAIECSWLLKLPKEHQINVSFSTMDLGDDCEKSFIEIFNGNSPKSPRIAKFCKDNVPKLDKLPYSIISQENTLLIDYHFSADGKGKGFNLTYKPLINGCGGIFHDRNRIIQTPGYPKNYPNNSECEWEVVAPEGYHIGLSFIGRFHLEESDNCVDDFVKIWDWRKEDWNLLNTFCGRETPPNVNSTGNKMRIRFKSNDKIQARGFMAKWEFNCGGTFVATTTPQYIISPGYPYKYPNRIKCVYTIEPSTPKEYVNLEFQDFDLEYGMPSCVSDNVTVEPMSSYYDRTIRTLYCDAVKPPPNSYKNGVKITFTTDSFLVRRGFKFSFVSTGCGGNITYPTKISTPTVALDPSYFGYVDCEWQIIAPPKKIIAIMFVQLVTPYTASCSYDNIVIYDGLEKNSENKLATLCGNLTANLPTINSPNNTLTITTKIDPNYKNMKFVMDVFFTAGPAEGCGGTFNLTSPKTIRSPNIKEVADCYWKFMAPVDYTIEFEIADLDIQTCTRGKCYCGFLEIRDGGTLLSTLISKLCNSTSSVIKYQTTTRYGFLRYLTGGSESDSFRITAKPIISPCGQSALNVTKEMQKFTSPNYPDRYPENIRCRWLLQTETSYKKMVIRFKQFDLSDETIDSAPDDRCKYDYLEIENGNQHQAYGEGLGPSTVFAGRGKSSTNYVYSLMGVHTFCGRNNRIFDYYPPTDSVAIIFQSKYGTNRGKGFEIEYRLTGCNRNYTEDFGKIAFSLTESQDCIIGISVQSNKTISLYFSEFYSSDSKNCSEEYLQILDGDMNTGEELRKICGYERANSIFSKTNQLWLKAHSKKNVIDLHIDLTYTSTDKGRGCGGTIYDVAGVFTSPMYPKDYRNNNLCVWYIRVPTGTRVELDFTVLDIQASCDLNYLKVTTYDNGLKNEHQFCKGDSPAKLISDEKATVTYQSSVHNGGVGWTAAFTAVQYEDTAEVHHYGPVID
ncbi:cubilin [Harmonia axyridis]|uniref:cubilin n=1 Tax=Harmonia axyridis TaxID=115357 RepID=UPI001E276049|nr:cubilin [Harmonia axyridis]